jgi:integrase
LAAQRRSLIGVDGNILHVSFGQASAQGRGRCSEWLFRRWGDRSAEKTGRTVRFELTEQTRQAVDDYIRAAGKKPGEFMFTASRGMGQCMTTRQYARLLSEWIASVGLDPHLFGTHSLRRTKATLIYRRTGNLRAVQQLLGHTKIESTVRYLGIEVDDALSIAEQVDL